jgi:hypothetical protein
MICHCAEWNYGECRIFFSFKLSVFVISVFTLNVVMQSVVMLSVVARKKALLSVLISPTTHFEQIGTSNFGWCTA